MKFKVGDEIIPIDRRPEVRCIEITGIDKSNYVYTVYYTTGQIPWDNYFEIERIDSNWRKVTKLEKALK